MAKDRAKRFKKARETYIRYSLFTFEDAEKAAKYWLRKGVSVRCEQHRVILTTVDGTNLEIDILEDMITIMGNDGAGYFDSEDVESIIAALKCCFRQFAN
ncbi:hypothetical protein HZB60_12380 [candidate division KSB1 bacterium]|nr:hypothetical protein [candidate division KSB1 bacterium]